LTDFAENEFEIIVAGGGIAGLTAGLVAARLGRKTLILIGDVLGGHLLSIESIEGYPGFPEGVAGYELCPSAQVAAVEAGAEVEMEMIEKISAVDGKWQIESGSQTLKSACLIIATGTRLRSLGIPGEEDFFGKGVSHCASCDAPLLRDQPVVVVGGGDSAMQEALTLAEAASSVVILQDGPELTGQASFRDRVHAQDKIEIRFDSALTEIVGDQGVTGVKIRNGSDTEQNEIPAAGVFIFVGQQPNSEFLADVLDLDDSGRIQANATMQTTQPGLFAAGTIRAGSAGRAAASAGDGTTAAVAADRYLSDGNWG
jgi:thioredoxin reductase (NADPH)